MSRTVLAIAAFIGLIACGGTAQPSKRATASASPAASTPRTTSRPAQTQRKKAAAKPDTTRARNPLTN